MNLGTTVKANVAADMPLPRLVAVRFELAPCKMPQCDIKLKYNQYGSGDSSLIAGWPENLEAAKRCGFAAPASSLTRVLQGHALTPLSHQRSSPIMTTPLPALGRNQRQIMCAFKEHKHYFFSTE